MLLPGAQHSDFVFLQKSWDVTSPWSQISVLLDQ